jgi:hypothetical protein
VNQHNGRALVTLGDVVHLVLLAAEAPLPVVPAFLPQRHALESVGVRLAPGSAHGLCGEAHCECVHPPPLAQPPRCAQDAQRSAPTLGIPWNVWP